MTQTWQVWVNQYRQSASGQQANRIAWGSQQGNVPCYCKNYPSKAGIK